MSSESLFSSTDELQIENDSLKSQIKLAQEKLKNCESQINWLSEQLMELKRARFGKKSERWESSEQLVFNEIEVEAGKVYAQEQGHLPQGDETEIKAHKRKRGYRKPLPEGLPREVVKIELPKEEQLGADGTALKVIGWEVSEKLKYEPAKMSVLEIHRAKYGAESGDYEKVAPVPPSIVPKGMATPELLSAIIVAKYADGLPLYRLESIFKRQGVDLSRGTMARWMLKVAEALRPVCNVLSDRLLNSFYVACDETHVQVLKENGRKAKTKSWMIVRSTPYGEKKVVLFDYNPSRAGAVMKDLFSDFKGILQCDGLNSYDGLEVSRLGCAMHARRRFEKALVNGAKSGISLAEQGLEFFQKLYKIEKEINDKPPDERQEVRESKAKPIWEELKIWAETNRAKTPIKSKIGEAFTYLLNQYECLIGYLADGRLNIDNGFTERAIRKFAIGRNNWMFSDTTPGAEASSLLYSLIVTAKINNVNPYQAMVQLCTEAPLAKTIDDYERLAEIILSASTPR